MTDEERADRAWADYTRAFREGVMPQLLSSAVMVHIGERGDPERLDIRGATELGAMLLLGKPLVVVVAKGETITPALRRAADVVLDDFDPTDQRSQDRMARAVRRLARRADERP